MSSSRSRYTFENEDTLPAGVSNPIRTLLENWDKTDDETHAYLAAFTNTATLDLPPNYVSGHDAIRGMRNSLIHHINGPVIGVRHTFGRLYVMPDSVSDGSAGSKGGMVNVCVTGKVEYTVRGGKVAPQDYATRFDLVSVGEGGGEWKIQLAKIYSDNAPLMAAIAEMPPL